MADQMFHKYIGIDYSGAQSPGLSGLQCYEASWEGLPKKITQTDSSGKPTHWTRSELAKWVVEYLGQGDPTLVGIDHAFSFPIDYFDTNKIKHDWQTFLDFFCEQGGCKLGEDSSGLAIKTRLEANTKYGEKKWYRTTEKGVKAKSVFDFNGPGVAHSTHAGLPWLRYIRSELGNRVHFWPFDGWDIPKGKSVIAEIYPALWNKRVPKDLDSEHEHDAYAVARWMQQADSQGYLASFFEKPMLFPGERDCFQVEGWILGVK